MRAEARSLKLDREAHITYLSTFLQRLSFHYTALDASRPWLLYWTLHAFALLDCELGPTDQRRAVSTLAHCRPLGSIPPNVSELAPIELRAGFGGSNSHRPHLATTYASVLSLACIGDERAWSGPKRVVDRQALHDWFMQRKQPDGSFTMHEGGEVDVRGTYLVLAVATLLNILTPDLARGAADFVARCQTYEGGLASAAYASADRTHAAPLGEAHGGYAFCSVASYFGLLPFGAEPGAATLDVEALLRWTASMQAVAAEGGGFRGRTNKLVDGCYSWWCGGLWSLIDALLERSDPADAALFDREALQEYVLVAAQQVKGGLADKPGKRADAYHTCYNLSGLSAAQHHLAYSADRVREVEATFVSPDFAADSGLGLVKGANESDDDAIARMRRTYAHALGWVERGDGKMVVGQPENELVRCDGPSRC